MNKLLKKAGLAVALGATALTAGAMPAAAQRYHRYYHDDGGTAIVAGIAGLAIGAAIASSDRRYYDPRYDYDRRYYYDHGYYPRDGYYYRDYYDHSYNRGYYHSCYDQMRWDPYLHRRVLVRYCD